jgi:hypothetical protein
MKILVHYFYMVCLFSISLAAMDVDRLKKWKEEDKQVGRIFRYSLFFDVMGMNEERFQEKIFSRGLEKVDWRKITTIKRPRAIDDILSPFRIYTIGQLSKKRLVQSNTSGSIKILDGYVIWNEGKSNPRSLTDLEKNIGVTGKTRLFLHQMSG